MSSSIRIYSEECVYSVRARLLRSFLYFQSQGLSFLGKIRTIAIDTELPCNLRQFHQLAARFLPWTLDSMIYDHTTFNFYKTFLPVERHDSFFASMTDIGTDVHLGIGLKASGLSHSKFPLFCPECSRLDMDKIGEPFYKRIHQLSNIQVCPEHNCLLVEYRPGIEQIGGIMSFPLRKDVVANSTTISNNCSLTLQLAKQAQQILTNRFNGNLKEIAYEESFRSKGYFHEGKLLRSELVGLFQRFYSDVKNEYFKSRIIDSYHWIGQMVLTPEKVFNPYQHLLFNKFAEELSAKILPAHPFGSGPFPCFNKICAHYLKDIIQNVEIEFNRAGKLSGIFKCKACGMVYIRQPNAIASKRFQIRNRGDIWLAQLKEFFDAGNSNQEIASKLGSNSSVISKYRKKSKVSAEIKKKRIRWRKLVKQFGYTKARVTEPKLYSWLFRYDREWLLSSKPGKTTPNNSQLRIDWNKLDYALCEHITLAIAEIQTSNRRISRELISRLVPNGNSIHSTNLQKLPKAKNLIELSIETPEQFQLKKVERSFQTLVAEHRSISKWSILKGAGISKPSLVVQSVVEKLAKRN